MRIVAPLGLALALSACHAPPAAPRRVDLEAARTLVRARIFDENPRMNPATEFPLVELSPPGAWELLGVQLFQVPIDAPVQGCETFALRQGEVVRLGMGFGGMGVHSTLVTDVDGDLAPDLAFVYSSGSGRHRSQAGLLRITAGRLQTLDCDWDDPGDPQLVRGEHGEALLHDARGPFARLEVSGGLLVVVDQLAGRR